MRDWSLNYVDGGGTPQAVSFAQLAALEGGRGMADGWMARFFSHKASVVLLHLPGVPPGAAPAIPFESRIQILAPDGTVQFQGYRTDRAGTADPQRPSSSYQFEDEWYFLEHCSYQQFWLQQATPGGGSHYVPFQNVVLCQPNPGQTYTPTPINGVITTGQQIIDILNWAIFQGAHLQVGEVNPAIYAPWYPLQNVKCAEALRHCLRVHPDCFTEIDYRTVPPTFHVRRRSNLTAVTLPYAYTDAAGRRHTASDIQPRPELQPKRVAIFYRVISNNYLLSTPVDIYPNSNLSVQGPVITGQSVGGAAAPYIVGGTPVVGTAMSGITGATVATIPVGAPGGLRALDYAVDLAGPKMTVSSAAITSASFDPTNLAWWRNKLPSLRQISEKGTIPNDGNQGALRLLSNTINGGGQQDIQIVLDGTDTPVDISIYDYELMPKSAPMAWMQATGGGTLQIAAVKITGHFYYRSQKQIGSASLPQSEVNDHPHSVRIQLCNSASLAASYSQYLSTGEAAPANLAQSIYESLATLQYSFTHTLVEKPFNGWLKPGKHAVNLAGGAADWATMNATVQQTEYKMHLDGGGITYDQCTVKCGPVEHLEPGELVQLFNVFANRDLTKIDTNERLTGQAAPGNTVAAANDTAQENSIPGIPDQGLQAFTAPDGTQAGLTNAITANPATGQTTVAQLDSTTGTQLTSSLVMTELTGAGAPGPSTLA